MAKYTATSPYFSTKSTSWYLKPMQWRALPKDRTDVYYTVKTEWIGKPTLLANDLYGDPGSRWVVQIMTIDLIRDPNTDLEAGMVIRMPTLGRLKSLLG